MRKASLCAAVVVLSCSCALGQQYKVLYSFLGPSAGDGDEPVARLVADDAGNLYGTTRLGGSVEAPVCDGYGCGTVFEVSPNNDGAWTERIIYSFCANNTGYTCPDGAVPMAGLVLDSAGNLYGTTSSGGSEPCPTNSIGCGPVFELSPPSLPGGAWTHTVIYNFCTSYPVCPDGDDPQGDLIFDALGNLYGTTVTGGANALGTVFQLTPGPGGWTEAVLYSLCSVRPGSGCKDGALPYAGPSLDSSGNLYGTTEWGGTKNGYGGGLVYKLSPGQGGWSESVVHAFSDSSYPSAVITFDQKGNLYTTLGFGENGVGGAFRTAVDGGKSYYLPYNNSDGTVPGSGLLIDPTNNRLYGTTTSGADGYGSVLMIAGKSISVLHSFLGGPDGANPGAAVVADRSRHLYGTTAQGGTGNGYAGCCGVVFEVTP
ncbi:MAG: choice-of-anchor tandem repeat GloVer-containing protein [Terriglobales bacterium]